MERSKISTVGGSDNAVGKQNKNTRTLKGLLGLSDEQLQRLDFKAGDSEWLENYQREFGYGDYQEKQRVRRFLQSFRGKLSRTKLTCFDTVGRKLPDYITKTFSSTAFKNKEGALLSLWHWTDTEFTDFEIGDIGFHVGTFDVKNNTHLRVLNHTPGIFIEKAWAKDRPIVMPWDIAYLAIKKKSDGENQYMGINKEDPAHFISRLQSLNKLTPRNDLAGSSYTIIDDFTEKSNTAGKDSSKKSENSARRNSIEPTVLYICLKK